MSGFFYYCMMRIDSLTVGLWQVNCYMIHKDGHILCIDPGASTKRLVSYLEQFPEETLDAILLTHGHFDHIGAVNELVETYHCPVYLSPEDDKLVHTLSVNSIGKHGAVLNHPYTPYPYGSLTIGPFEIAVYDTPGHTEGSVCLQMEDHLFSGDTVFRQSVGRTDLYGGSNVKLNQSLN